ncbi:MAG: hypothetical protein PWQ93_1416 [Clostridiales bacterium]|jgi:phage baseplate assembly protein W|nr:hypothetical protein [Clostridiales bacterium]
MNEHLGTDIWLKDGDIVVLPTGDASVVSGTSCLIQDIANRLITPVGGHWAHPEYGSILYQYVQSVTEDTDIMAIEQETVRAVESDPRVVAGTTEAKVISVDRETIRIKISFQAVNEHSPINMVLGYGPDEAVIESGL